MQPKKIAVVGAGIAGLTAAHTLKQAGHDVTVYEKEALVGGRMSSRKKDNLVFDIGANHLCDLYDSMKEITNEHDIAFEPMNFLEYRVYKNGGIVPIKSCVSKLSQLRLALVFLLTTKKSLAMSFFNLTTAKKLDTTNAYDNMKKWLGKESADYIVDPFSTTYQFHSAKEISLSAVRTVLGLIKYRHKEWDLHQTKPSGMIELPNKLASMLDVRLSTPVSEVTGGDAPTIVVNGETVAYDAVIMAATATTTKKLLTNSSTELDAYLSQVKYASTISLAFRVDKNSLPGTAIVWVPRVESSTISGYTNERMKGGEFVDETTGESLICAWLHEDYAKEIMHLSDEEIFAKTKIELLKYCPWFTEESELANFDLQRWPEAMPKFYPGSVKAAATFLGSHQGDNNIFLCGDYLNSLWTEGALRCGQRVAKSVMEA